MRLPLSVLSVLILLTVMTLLTACRPVRQPPAPAVILSKPDDQALVRWEGDAISIDIHSPSGIGAAQIAWPGGATPRDGLLLRLHLNGLEGLQISNGTQQAALSVENAPPYTVRFEGETQAIDVQRSEGVFIVRLGQDWLQTNSLDVQWIDFYR